MKTKFGRRIAGALAFCMVLATVLTVPFGFLIPASAADADYTFSSGAVLLTSEHNGKNVLIQNGVFSVTVNGATNVNIIFDSVTMDRRYDSDTSGTVTNLYSVALSLGWKKSNRTYYAQVCPLLITNNSEVKVAFRGTNNFYAGVNGCTVSTSSVYTKSQSGGGFAGIQVDSGSTLTIEQSNGTLNVYGAHQGTGDNSENSSYGYSNPTGATQNSLAGGAGIGGGVTYNTSTCASTSYTAGTPGTIIINGGNINAHGGHEAAGIGGGVNGAATTTSITINGGNINAFGGRWAAGIGDGDSLQENYTSLYSNAYAININGGTINATGGVGCPGIGSTDSISTGVELATISGLEITINGGKVTAKSGYPDNFNPNGTSGPGDRTDAAAAIGAGGKTNMKSNSITISSDAEIIASGFGSYSVTENGTNQSVMPVVNIDSDGYMFLGRFSNLASYASRTFELFEAQRFSRTIDGTTYRYTKYVTQPSDGSAGEIYYYCPTATGNEWLMKAGTDGSIENATVVELADTDALKTAMADLKLTLCVDDNSVKFNEVTALAHFRSIAISLPNPQEHGGIYALKMPTDSMYGYSGSATLPKSGYVTITIGAEHQGTISGNLVYPSELNMETDVSSEALTDLDVYRTEDYTYGSNGLIGDAFMENVYAYKVYIENGDNTAYIYLRYSVKDNVTTVIECDDSDVTRTGEDTTQGIITGQVNMTGETEKVIRIKKTDTVSGSASNSIVYKITVIRKAVYTISLKALDKTYDGNSVSPAITAVKNGTETVETVTDEELKSVTYTYSDGSTSGLTDAPKDAGTYTVTATILAQSYTATGTLDFTIAKKELQVSRIENYRQYVKSTEYSSWTAPHTITDPGVIYLSGLVSGESVTLNYGDVYYNNIDIGYSADKITLEKLRVSGDAAKNYTIASTQTVLGQISYSLVGSIFRTNDDDETGTKWDKFYPTDSTTPVDDASADYHSPKNTDGYYTSHAEYVWARTQGSGASGAVYAVEIEFGTMYFNYTKEVWNTSAMKYEKNEDSFWIGFDGVNNCVTVINRSNAAIDCNVQPEISFFYTSYDNGTTGILAKVYRENSKDGTPVDKAETITVDAAKPPDSIVTGDEKGTPTKQSFYLYLFGNPQSGNTDNYIAVGDMTVTIKKSSD